MRRLTSVLVLVLGVGAVISLHAQVASPAKPALSYDDVIAAPAASVGKTVSWVVRFTNVLVDVGPDGAVTKVRALFEYRDAGDAWRGRGVIAPQPQDFKWPEPPFVDRAPQTQPRILSGTIVAVEESTGADGRRILTPVLSGVTLEALPSEAVFEPGAKTGVSWPVAVRSEKPVYTQAAMDAKIEGSVELQMVVQADGTVGDVRIIRSLDSQTGLDAQAIDAARQWRFTPGLKDGKPVATSVFMMLEFRLHKLN